MPSKRPKRMVIVQPDGIIITTDHEKEPSLEDLQKAVGGYIEHVRCRFDGKVRHGYVNEMGKFQSLPLNPRATSMCNEWGYGPIVGNLCLVFPVPEVDRAEA